MSRVVYTLADDFLSASSPFGVLVGGVASQKVELDGSPEIPGVT